MVTLPPKSAFDAELLDRLLAGLADYDMVQSRAYADHIRSYLPQSTVRRLAGSVTRSPFTGHD